MRQHFPAEIKFYPCITVQGIIKLIKIKSMKKINELSGFEKIPRIKKIIRIMKLTGFLIAVSIFSALAGSSYSQTKLLNLDMEKATVKEVLSKIEDQSEFYFMYSGKIIDVDREVSVNNKNQKIDQVLKSLFEGTNVKYVIKDRFIVLTDSKSDGDVFDVMQQKSVSGIVTDESGVPLPGVTVVVKGTTTGTITDADGNYSLQNVQAGTTLIFSFVGMKTQEINVGSQTSINVTMEEDAIGMDEVVVVGYGSQKKSDITGSVASFDSDAIELVPVTNVASVMQGRVAGVNLIQAQGDAEAVTSILVRGQNSLTASNDPLIILDGIQFSGGLSAVNPHDIKSIEILKDASSAAIYGARAANGVILITTKKGKSGKPKISYYGNFSVSEVSNLPDLMDGETFYKRKVEYFKTPDNELENFMTQTELENYNNGVSTDWAKLALRQGQRQEHTLSVSGGSENSSYYISGAMDQTKGIAINDDFSRFTLKINYENKVGDWFTIGTNTLLGYIDRSGVSPYFSYAFGTTSLRMNPLTKPYNEDGSLTIYPWPEQTFYGNPIEPVNYINEDITRSINTNNYIEVKLPVDGLTYRINTGYTFNNRLYQEYRGTNTQIGETRSGWATTSHRYNEEWVIENLLNYKKDFGDHSIFLTALYSSQKTQTKSQRVRGENFTSDIRTYYQYGATDVINLADDFTESTILSQMLRANYGFKSKYLLTLTARRDGYSGFGSETKFGVFPSIAVAWNATKEEFVQDLGMEWLDVFKLRLSYGENGNMAISPYSTLPQLSSLNYLDGNLNSAFGYYPQALGDPTLGWETSETMNLGADFTLFKGRIQGSADFFNTRTTDLLLNKTISPVNGTTSITQNIGETKNKGFELQVSSVNVDQNNFSWSTDATFSLYRSQIVNVGLTDASGNYIDDLGSRWFIGQPVNVLFGYKYDGVWQLDDDIANSHQPEALPGDVKVVDINGDGEITPDDRAILGSSQPKFTIGINNTLKYKNVSLSFFIYSVQGVTKSGPLWSTFVNDYSANLYNYDFWSETNPTNEYPANRASNNTYGASRLEDASFIRLKDITLNYSFNKGLLSKLKLNQLDIFINAKNLFTITNYKYGMDPEFNGVSVTNGSSAIPLSKTYLIGLKLGF